MNQILIHRTQDRPIPAQQELTGVETAQIGVASKQVPLVLDLDGTLLRGDLLFEGIAGLVRANPLNLFKIGAWALRGRAFLKQRVAEASPLDYASLPVNEALAAYAAGQKEAGRQIVIATAADENAARRFAVRFAFVDTIIASDGATNLKGETKASLLQWRFPQGFDYAGDSAADLPVWKACRKMILVEPSRRVAAAAAALGAPELLIEKPSRWKVLAKGLRLHQWAKNALVFAPLLLSGMALEAGAWLAAGAAFIGLGLAASATYLINDLVDLPHDRQHRSKSRRPLAAGHLGLPLACGAAAAGLAGGLAVSALAGWATASAVAVYVAVTLSYSFALKRAPFVDALTLASLFTLRLVIGGIAVSAVASVWLLTFSMFLFTSLSLAKRHVEIAHARRTRGVQTISGRGYRSDDEPVVAGFGIAAAVASVLIFVLYLVNEAFKHSAFTFAPLLWAFPCVLFLWLGRIWLLCGRHEMDDDPVAFSIRDRISIFAGAATLAIFALAMALPG